MPAQGWELEIKDVVCLRQVLNFQSLTSGPKSEVTDET